MTAGRPGSRRWSRAVALAAGALVLASCVAAPPPPPTAPGVASPTHVPAVPGPIVRPARPVTITVDGPTGAVADAWVCAVRPRGEERCATSGSEGRAVVDLVPGTYAIRATPAEGRRLREGVVTVDLSEAGTAYIRLDGLATISGTVRDVDGRPIRQAEVCAHAATGVKLECARSRADGTYTVEVRPGIHKLEIAGPPDGSRFITQWARGRIGSFEADLIDSRTGDVSGADVVLIRGVVLSGRVTAARDGAVVKEAQVCTYTLAAPLGWECELGDKDGGYALLREPGRYWVWVIPPGERGSRLIPQRYDRVHVGVDATPFVLSEDRRLDVALTEGTILHGRVATSDGAPVVLGLVCVDTPFPTGRICRITGDDGTYEVATRPETYVVNVIAPDGSDVIGGYWRDAQPDWTKAERIDIGASDLRLDMVLPRGVRFTGTVRDSRGSPVEGATVNVNDATGPRFFGSTDIHGRYSVAVLPGRYTVDVFAPRIFELVSVVGQEIAIDIDAGYDVVLPDATP